MSGLQLIVDDSEVRILDKRIDRLPQLDRTELLDGIGELVASQTRHRIKEEKTEPSGKPWRQWSPDYAKTRKAHHSLLINEGAPGLLESIQFLVTGDDRVEIGSDRIYAAVHQSDRTYLGLSAGNENELRDTIEGWLEQVVAA